MVGGFTIELRGIKFRDAYQEEGENKNGPLTNLICFYSYPQYHNMISIHSIETQ